MGSAPRPRYSAAFRGVQWNCVAVCRQEQPTVLATTASVTARHWLIGSRGFQPSLKFARVPAPPQHRINKRGQRPESRSVLHALRVIFVTLLLVSVTATAELRIASWNIQNLHWGEVKHFDYLTEIAQRFDLQVRCHLHLRY